MQREHLEAESQWFSFSTVNIAPGKKKKKKKKKNEERVLTLIII
jgi:hypothetical protein